eukprot:TRINITY_DN21668_c0_g1_i1.p1 TRINITY_DN21668_c0_g1~~TRINITY_DN21668_c0_g1_i1.p1  ORF type:complete len:852 (-),score=173.62 TRINITY_DN21668_c0_g1_i1:383-2938(-)
MAPRTSYGNKGGFSPKRQSRYSDDPGYVTIDGLGPKEKLPRPAAAVSADAVYGDAPARDASTPSSTRSTSSSRGDFFEKNCSRSFVWSTLESVVVRPQEVAANVPLPLAAICAPFSDGADAEALPVSDIGEDDPLRCSRCRCYANPFWRWSRRERGSFQCNMCGHHTEMPQHFLEEIDGGGQSADEEHRPELFYGSVDVTAPTGLDPEREAAQMDPAVFFLLEASSDSVNSGFFAAALDGIEQLMDAPDSTLRRRVALALFDSELQFFVPARSGRFRRVAVACEEEPFVPVAPATLFLDIGSFEARECLRDLLYALREGADPSSAGFVSAPRCSVAGDALRAAVEALSMCGGGDVMVLQASSPTKGLGAPLRPSPPELTAAPQHADFYKETLSLCTRGGVAVNVVTAPGAGVQLDVETLQWLVWQTGGDALHMQAFCPERGPQLAQHLRHWAGKMQGSAYGCVVRLRCSKGLSCTGLVAPWSPAASSSDSSAFELARLSPDASFAFTLKPEARGDDEDYNGRYRYEKQYLYIQVAVLYTNVKGKRLLRLHTTSINIVPTMRAVYQSASVGPLLAFGMKQAVLATFQAQTAAALGKKPPKKQPRDVLLDLLLEALAGFQHHCFSGRVGNKSLVINKRLCLLPLLTLGARKLLYSASGAGGGTANGKDQLYALLRMPIHSLLAAVYPRIYPVELRSDEEEISANEGDATCSTTASTSAPGVPIPTPLAPLQESVVKGNAPAYIITNGLTAWLYMAPSDASPKGPRCGPDMTEEDRALLSVATALSAQLRDELEPTPSAMTLSEVVNLSMSAEQPKEQKVFVSNLFIEDQGFNEMSYLDWVQYLDVCLRRDREP